MSGGARRPSGRGSSRRGARPAGRQLHTKVKTAKGRKLSSKLWLERQLNDPYVAEAKARGYRSRAAFKLLQIDEKHGILKKGGRVVDLGAAPGGWTQVALERCGKGAQVVAVDLLDLEPIEGAAILKLDFLEEGAEEAITEALGGPAELVMSDMAAPSTGHPKTDHLRIMMLAETALDFALQVLAPGGAFLAKVLQGGSEKELLDLLRRHFAQVRHVKPAASRKDSAELYVLATGFRA